SQPGQGAFEGGEHGLAGEPRVPLVRAEKTGDVPAARLLERNPDAPPEKRIERADVEVLGLREEALALRAELLEREAEAVVELAVSGRAELLRRSPAGLGDAHVTLVQVLLGERDARTVEPLAPPTVGLV